MRTLSKAVFSLLFLGLAFFPTRSQGQTPAAQAAVPEHLISGSPLTLLANWFNGEYERTLNNGTTVGISGGWLDLDEDDYTGVTGILRYYPRQRAFQGFYIGARGGFFRVDDGEKESTPLGLGLDIGYGWLLGPGGSLYIGLGLGVTRLLAGNLDHASATIPMIRLVNVGIAF